MFNDQVKTVRVNNNVWRDVEDKVRRNPMLYGSPSHFIRIAIMRELRRKV